jgi:hypothetical protein
MNELLTFDGDSEVQRQIFQVAGVVLEEDEPLVEGRVQRSEIIQEALSAKPLKLDVQLRLDGTPTKTDLSQEERRERYLNEDTIVHSLAQDPSDEPVPVQAMRCEYQSALMSEHLEREY